METLFIGSNLIILDEVDSTNNYLAKLLTEAKLLEGTAIMTYNQTNGKGQIGNTWQSEKGQNLTFSLLLQPGFLHVQQQFFLSMAIALGIRDLIAYQSNMDVKIKWPNDIYVNNKKICGILIENSVSSNHLRESIVGIGINVNQNNFSEAPRATSLSTITGKQFDLVPLLKTLFTYLEPRYLKLKSLKFQEIHEEYLSHLYLMNVEEIFQVKGYLMKGKITGVKSNGRLQFETVTEKLELDIKEIIFP